MQGLMQDWPLTVDRILTHAAAWHPRREIVTRSLEGPIVRTTWSEVDDRARRFSSALLALGVRPGDRIATMAWNTARHIEAWYGIMGIGAVCHTLNPRLFADQLCYIMNHAEDAYVCFDPVFAPLVSSLAPHLPLVKGWIALCDREHMPKASHAA